MNDQAVVEAKSKPSKSRSKWAPGPSGTLVMGNAREFTRDPLGLFTRSVRDYGDLVGLRVGPIPAFLVNDPDDIKHVLVDAAAQYGKPARFTKALRPLMGNGLLNSEGDFWKRQRRIAQPLFHRQRIQGFGESMVASTAAMLAEWRAKPAGPVDVSEEMMKLTLHIVGKTLFSMDLGGEHDTIGPGVGFASRYVFEQANSMFITPKFVPVPGNLRFQRTVSQLDQLVYEIIHARRASGKPENDLLSMLMDARDDETGEGMSDQQLRDEVMTFYLAGHETTANALSWTLYLLARHPEAIRQLRAEATAVLADRAPRMEDLGQLPFTTRVLEEAMRLYPPAWLIGRTCVAEDQLRGYRVVPGALVLMSAYAVHRSPKHWENPEQFNPDNFLPERVKARPAYAYFPFGGGQRKCIGLTFAMMEMQLILPMIVRAFDWSLVDGAEVLPEPAVTLRPKTGIPMTLRPC